MKILVDLTHPAHWHLFRNVIAKLEERGHKVFVAIRDKDILRHLVEEAQREYVIFSPTGKGVWSMGQELIKRNLAMLRFVKQHQIDLLIGSSPNIAQVSRLTSARSIIFAEDDRSYTKLYCALTYPFADTICTPDSLTDNFGKKHITYNSYHELAYLHPDNFQPDPSVLEELGVSKGQPFFILRLVGLKAQHDVGEKGMSHAMKQQIAQELAKHGKVFISCEGNELPDFLQEYHLFQPLTKMHHALYYATLYVGDSQSMAMEAAVLGTPALRCNSFVGRISVLNELEHKYGLTYGFLPQQEQELLTKLRELLAQNNLREQWQAKREKLLADKMDLSQWMSDLLENYFSDGMVRNG